MHLTHVGFNSDTGEFTGLPKEWQQLLQESGISRQDQEANPQAVMDIVAFYQQAAQTTEEDAVWTKFGGAKGPNVGVDGVAGATVGGGAATPSAGSPSIGGISPTGASVGRACTRSQ